MFNWATESIERLAWHIAKVSRQQTMAAITYYRRKGEVETVHKIKLARALAKKYKVILLAEEIKQEIDGVTHGEEDKFIKENEI